MEKIKVFVISFYVFSLSLAIVWFTIYTHSIYKSGELIYNAEWQVWLLIPVLFILYTGLSIAIYHTIKMIIRGRL